MRVISSISCDNSNRWKYGGRNEKYNWQIYLNANVKKKTQFAFQMNEVDIDDLNK